MSAKLIRFVCIGVLSGAIYALVTAALVSRLGVAPVPASIAGYCASVPASFLGHRNISFRSRGRWTSEAVRFVLMQAANIAVTALSMHGSVEWAGAPYWWGMIIAVVLIPIANFILMNVWVFRDQGMRGEG